MGRKGWKTVATRAGWFEVTSTSVQWPKVNGKLDDACLKPQPRVRGRWQDAPALVGRWKRGVARAADSPFSATVRSLEAALAALGPEESVVKIEIAGARDKVARLEQAIAAMGDFKGGREDTLVAALKRAQKDAQD